MTQKNTTFNFAEAVQKLEDITRWLQDHDLDLEQGLEKVKEGKQIVDECKKNLLQVENEFIEVKKSFGESESEPTPFSGNDENETVSDTLVTKSAPKKKAARTPAPAKNDGFMTLKKGPAAPSTELDDDDDLPF